MKQVMPAASPLRQKISACHSTHHHGTGFDRWELLSLVIEVRRELSLTDRDIMVLRAHLSVLPHGRLNAADLNVSYMNLTEIQGRACGMDKRRFRRTEVRLEKAGLVIRRLSANGRRFPERDQHGKVVNAYGIDLSPLLQRYTELTALKAEITERALQLKHKRNALSARISALLKLYHEIPEPLRRLRDALRNALRRKAPCETELEALERSLSEAEANAPTTEERHETISQPDKTAADDGQSVRHIDQKQKEINRILHCKKAIHKAWASTLTLRDFQPTPPATLGEVFYKLAEFGSYVAVKKLTLEAFLNRYGAPETIRVLDHIATCFETIREPDKYLGSMLRRAYVPTKRVGQYRDRVTI